MRNLTRLIRKTGQCIDVDIGFVQVTCKRRKPKVHNVDIMWPVLSMRSWCKYIFENHPSLLLGGHRIRNRVVWEDMFQTFWQRYQSIEPDHEIFTSGKPLGRCIPYMTHGDEGVANRKIPFMVESWQPCCSFLGTHRTAVSGNPGFSV